MLSSNLLKFKIPMLRVGGGLAEFDAEFKFAKIQNSYQNPVGGGGGAWWNQLSTFDAESKFAIKKKKNFFCEKCYKFSDKNWNGFVLDFEYRVVPLYEV